MKRNVMKSFAAALAVAFAVATHGETGSSEWFFVDTMDKPDVIVHFNANGGVGNEMDEQVFIVGEKQKLIESVKTNVVVGDQAFEVTMRLNDYWKYVEEGVRGSRNMSSPYRNPGWKAYPFILKWIEIKPVLPRPNSNGKQPTPKQLGYLITRSIVENGTQGSHDLQKVKDGVIPWYREKIAAALGHDMEHYIRKLVATK